MQESRRSVREGWGWLTLVSLAQGFLVLVAALAAIALLPALLGWSSSVVQSSSMEPSVSPGDVVLAAELPDDQPVPVGAVATFDRDGKLILHRLVKANDDGTFVTAGDANEQLDSEPVARGDITGVARLLVPAIGLPSVWVDRREFVPLALWFAVVAFAVTVVTIGFPRPDGDKEAEPARGRHAEPRPATGAVRTASIATLAVALIAAAVIAPHGSAHAAFTASTESTNSVWQAKVFTPLSTGRASGFGALAAVSVQSLSRFDTTVTGSVGTSPATSIVGFWPHAIIGDSHHNTPGARAEMADAAVIPVAAAERGLTSRLSPTLTGTLGPGTYESTSGAFTVSGNLVLDAKGDPSARFIFRAPGTLNLAHQSRIILTGGAQAANVWWVSGSMTAGVATAGSGAVVAAGNFVSTGSVALNGVQLHGRVVSLGGSISLRMTQITVPSQ